MYKRTAIFIIMLLIPVFLAAQRAKPKNDSNYDDRLLHFGFSMGVNSMDFIAKMKPESDLTAEVVTLKPGINIQIVTDYRPATYLDLRFLPGVSFGQRTINFYNENAEKVYDTQIESSFLEFPLSLKAKGMRLNNSRPYLIGGLNFRYDLAGKKEFDDPGVNGSESFIRLNKADLYYEVGAGIDFYLPYFKLTIEAKMSSGLRDVLNYNVGFPPYFNEIESLKSQIWVLSFHFE
ncbi:MAG: PorT family protein [Bacteroidales bacterium]|nr:PorT family protein [Bacteroidales bacterium]MDD3735861.1 porin family protein [Bacteroidales bacterium]NLD64641.1 PorT family protein [Bacteroidales bacterium]HPJ05936.1 porin family protein [Bacteroidales bacterium]